MCDFCIANIYTHKPNLTQLSSLATEIWPKNQIQMAAVATLNFTKSVTSGIYRSAFVWQIGNDTAYEIWCNYLHWRLRYDQKSKSKMATAAIVNFRKKSAIYVFSIRRTPISICKPNLVQIGQEVADIDYIFCVFPRCRSSATPDLFIPVLTNHLPPPCLPTWREVFPAKGWWSDPMRPRYCDFCYFADLARKCVLGQF